MTQLNSDLTQIDAFAELGVYALLLAAFRNLDRIGAGVFLEPVKFEVAVVVACRFRDDLAALQQLHTCAFDTVDDAIGLGRDAAADEAGRITPEVAIINPRLAAELGPHHLELVLPRHARHLVILELHGAHRAGRTGLMAAGLLPALVNEMSIERPVLRHLLLLVPPDVSVGAGVHQVLAALGALLVD